MTQRPSFALMGASVAALALVLQLAGCGGGGTTLAGVETGGTGVTNTQDIGPITGNGSIFVNGEELDTSGATLFNELGGTLTPAQLRIGMLANTRTTAPVTINGETTATASTVTIYSELEGMVQSVDTAAGTMVVLGQTVAVTPATWFDAALAGGLAAITPSATEVEIYAQYHPLRNVYVATRVALRTALPTYKIRGPLTALDSSAQTFVVGALTVSYAGIPAAEVPPLSVGRFVRVRLATTPTGSTWTATALVDGRPVLPNNFAVRLSGRISAWTSATQFRVDDVGVDAATASLAPAGTTAAAIVPGARVQIDGSVSGGVLTATTVTALGDETAANSTFILHGPITSLDTTAETIVVQGVAVHYASANFTGGTAATLAVGTRVRVTGPVDATATAITAQTIVFD